MTVQFNDLLGIYRSFKTNDDIMVNQMSKSTSLSNKHIRKLLELLFPRTTGKFLDSRNFFTELQALGTGYNIFGLDPEDNGSAMPAKEMAKLIRVYYYDAANPSLAQTIKGWYGLARKDAYLVPNPKSMLAASGARSTREDKDNNGIYDDYINAPKGLADCLDASEDAATKEKLKSKILMCLVDSPAIDFKLRNADKVEVFTNYIPAVAISQAVPYLDVKFLSKRNVAPIAVKERNIGFMSQLHFLMGDGKIDSDPKSTSANALIYDASKYVINDPSGPPPPPAAALHAAKIAAAESAGLTRDVSNTTRTAGLPETEAPAQSTVQKLNQHVFVTGMEMFTSPQTLINPDQGLSRYSPIINPFVPFATIVGLTVTMVPSYDVFSYKTATLILKMFDRSRLSEIADFLNPQLYSSAAVLLTYGWRAPQQQQSQDVMNQNAYHEFINNHMLMSESYGIQNSSISIDNSGVVTVTLVLFTKGGAELNDITPTGESIAFKDAQSVLAEKLNNLKKLATDYKISELFSASAKDVRGAIVIRSALNATFPELETKKLDDEIAGLKQALALGVGADIKAKEFLNTMLALYARPTKGGAQYAVLADLDIAAAKITTDRFKTLKVGHDLFSYIHGKRLTDGPPHPLVNDTRNIYRMIGDTNDDWCSFGKVFFKYFARACGGMTANDNALIDEYQIFFYSLNENAGPVASLNIAEFPIDVKKLEAAYTKNIVEKKGENMTLVTFLEIIRTSQFSNIRHPAFGFSDLYQKDKPDLIGPDAQAKFLQRALNSNIGTGEAFVQPAVDFYVESGFTQSTQGADDLLSLFEYSAEARTTNGKRKREDAQSIVRIHIFDSAATPHSEASQILKASNGGYIRKTGKFKKYVAPPKAKTAATPTPAAVEEAKKKIEAENKAAAARLNNVIDQDSAAALNLTAADTGVQYKYVTLRDEDGKPSFDVVKRVISEMVPTIIVGAEGSMITNMTYSSNMDSALGTMMIMNGQSSQSPSQPNGSGLGELPLRVIPGQLTMTLMGCPLLEYMQQFFVDLGTGTTLDNLYNVIGITHKFDPGHFSTEVKFGFYDAYGKYEGANAVVNDGIALATAIRDAAATAKDAADAAAAAKK